MPTPGRPSPTGIGHRQLLTEPGRRGAPCQACSQRHPLAIGQSGDCLVLGDPKRDQEHVRSPAPPAALASQQLHQRHARGLPWRTEKDLTCADLPGADAALELSARDPHIGGELEGSQALRSVPHDTLLPLPIEERPPLGMTESHSTPRDGRAAPKPLTPTIIPLQAPPPPGDPATLELRA
jgi:hypothetical protein